MIGHGEPGDAASRPPELLDRHDRVSSAIRSPPAGTATRRRLIPLTARALAAGPDPIDS